MRTDRNLVVCFALLLLPVLSSCKTTAPDDVFLFDRNDSVPNVTREADKFVLTFRLLSAAKTPITKDVKIVFKYVQLDPSAKHPDGTPCAG